MIEASLKLFLVLDLQSITGGSAGRVTAVKVGFPSHIDIG